MAGTEATDVVVCGGGIVGASCAFYLTRRGARVTLVERTGVANAASGKAGGFLARDWSTGALGRLSELSFDLHASLAQDLGADRVGYRRVLTRSLAASPSSRRAVKTQLNAGMDSVLDAEGTAAAFPWLNGRQFGSLPMGDPSSTAQVHPRHLTHALVDEAVKAGCTVVTDIVDSVAVEAGGSSPRVLLRSGGALRARSVVLALGPWAVQAAAWTGAPVPIEGSKVYSTVLRLGAPLEPPVCLFTDHQDRGRATSPEVYPRPCGEVYVCGGSADTPLPDDPADVVPEGDTCARLREVVRSMAPSLPADAPTTDQACYLPNSVSCCQLSLRPILIVPAHSGSQRDGLPLIGPVSPAGNVILAAGHGCWGILNEPGGCSGWVPRPQTPAGSHPRCLRSHRPPGLRNGNGRGRQDDGRRALLPRPLRDWQTVASTHYTISAVSLLSQHLGGAALNRCLPQPTSSATPYLLALAPYYCACAWAAPWVKAARLGACSRTCSIARCTAAEFSSASSTSATSCTDRE